MFPRISNSASDGAGRDGRGAGEKYLRFLVAHAAGEITVRGADAFEAGFVDAPKRVHRPAEARGATGVLRHLHTGTDEDFPNRLAAPTGGLQVVNNLRRGRHAKRVNRHAFAAEDAGDLHEVAGLAAGARTDVGAVEFHMAHLPGLLALARVGMTGDGRFELVEIHDEFVSELLVFVRLH